MSNNKDRENDTRTARRVLGDRGESIAAEFLVKQGFVIKDRNYLRKYGEIDIVAVRGGVCHFVEVKTVSCESVASVLHETVDRYRPEDNVHPWKLQRLARVIQAYLLDKRLWDVEWMVDIITVYIDKRTGESVTRILEDIVL